MSSGVKILRRTVILPENDVQNNQTALKLVDQVVDEPPASSSSNLYNDLDFVVQQFDEPVNIPMMLADPTFKPHYNGTFVQDFCKQTSKNVHLYGPMGTGKLETIVRAMWGRHVVNITEAFVIVCSSNEMVQFVYSFVSQHLAGQVSFQGIAISSSAIDSTMIFNGQLLICTYDTIAKLKRANIAASGLVTVFFLDAEMICVPQQYNHNKHERGFTAKRRLHSNGAIVVDPPSIHNLYCDAQSNCKSTFFSFF